MAVRYPSLARRKQVSKHRDQEMKRAVASSAGFVQEVIPTVEREPLPEVFDGPGVNVYDLDHFRHPGRSNAAVGPFIVACVCGYRSGEIDDYDAAEQLSRGHYRKEFA